MPVNIHGKSYNTVAERILSAGKDLLGVSTEVLSNDPVVIKATITLQRMGGNMCTFSGISAANPKKTMESESPYEVAETSAVGRALAFAGYETTNGIASAEEVNKAISSPLNAPKTSSTPTESISYGKCVKCGAPNAKSSKTGNIYCSDLCWKTPEKQTLSQAGLETDKIPF